MTHARSIILVGYSHSCSSSCLQRKVTIKSCACLSFEADTVFQGADDRSLSARCQTLTAVARGAKSDLLSKMGEMHRHEKNF